MAFMTKLGLLTELSYKELFDLRDTLCHLERTFANKRITAWIEGWTPEKSEDPRVIAWAGNKNTPNSVKLLFIEIEDNHQIDDEIFDEAILHNDKKGWRMNKKHKFECVGFMFINGRINFTHPEDYLDFRDKIWSGEEILLDLKRGVMPPGMLIRASSGGVVGKRIGVVVGNYNESQEVVLLQNIC